MNQDLEEKFRKMEEKITLLEKEITVMKNNLNAQETEIDNCQEDIAQICDRVLVLEHRKILDLINNKPKN